MFDTLLSRPSAQLCGSVQKISCELFFKENVPDVLPKLSRKQLLEKLEYRPKIQQYSTESTIEQNTEYTNMKKA